MNKLFFNVNVHEDLCSDLPTVSDESFNKFYNTNCEKSGSTKKELLATFFWPEFLEEVLNSFYISFFSDLTPSLIPPELEKNKYYLKNKMDILSLVFKKIK